MTDASPAAAATDHQHRVVVVGSGFGGLFAAKALRHKPVQVTLVAGTSHHLFQPLLYQVATGILSEGEIAPSTREILRRQKNAEVLLGTVTDVDLSARTVTAVAPGATYTLPYDSLIVAAGAGQSYFGNDQFSEYAPGMKSIDDALELRGRIFGAFELAEVRSTDEESRQRLLTFVVVGAGATGVEMAGQLAELAHRTLPGDFRRIDPRQARIVLLDAAPTVLPAYGGRLSADAERRLTRLGVEVLLNRKVVNVDGNGIEFVEPEGQHRRIEASTKIWAAGVAASPLGRRIADAAGAETDRAGRVKVNPDCTLPGHPEVFLIGDMMALGLPGVAQVAIQSGRHAAGEIVRRVEGRPTGAPFQYHDKGDMATVSRFAAIARIGKLRLTGLLAWLLWLVVHLMYLVGFKNRVTTVLHWAVSFIGRHRSQRTATEQQVFARTVMRSRTVPAATAGPLGRR